MLRNEFLKFGRDLEAAKEKDMIKYYSILEELKESYRQCGTVHSTFSLDVFSCAVTDMLQLIEKYLCFLFLSIRSYDSAFVSCT